mmetsp:Transcript_31568/g.47708  ORF Transcript_31568/g.47708 Transcript_31568/m.47708 type:complete len:323 (+) Transcript_31568:1126-2094(+)
MVTRGDDPEWSAFVSYVLQSLIEAEKQNITQLSAYFHNSNTFLDEKSRLISLNAVKAIGNYGELYERHLQYKYPRIGLDFINVKGNTGLIYSLPFGNIDTDDPAIYEHGKTLRKIWKRGKVLCGIASYFEEFPISIQQLEALRGFHEDYCRALSAGVFVTDTEGTNFPRVEFVELPIADQFGALANGTIDVLSGGIISHSANPSFSFSQPSFYSTPEFERSAMPSFGMITRQDDQQWSKLVFWVVSSTFYAEENYIEQRKSYHMPLVNLFGPESKNTFRKIIQTVGNYGEIYTRNLEAFFPRRGTRNMLNSLPYGPQHFPLL